MSDSISRFDAIRPFYDAEVNDAILSSIHHPMMKALMDFAFPDTDESVWKEQLNRTHSIRDFQINFAYRAVKKVLEKTSDGVDAVKKATSQAVNDDDNRVK